MNFAKRVVLFLSLAMLFGTTARAQLTCNGSLVCNTTTPVYSFTNNSSTGNGLNVTAGSGNGIYLLMSAGTGLFISSGFGKGIDVGTASTQNPAIHASTGYYHTIEAEAGHNSTQNFHAIHALQTATTGVGGYAVYGESSRNTGVYGKALLAGQYGVYASGNLGASGTKTFVEPHPYDASKQIHYAALEGPEAGTYFRGSGRIVKGVARISVPEDFRIVTAEGGLTVHVTPIGQLALVACVKKDLNEIVVQGNRDVEFDFLVHGVRKAFSDFQPVVDNTDFVPETADDVQFAAGLPSESLRRLKSNGTLNEDGTINVGTAEELGWAKKESWTRSKAEQR